jgi:hypothetical protein
MRFELTWIPEPQQLLKLATTSLLAGAQVVAKTKEVIDFIDRN